MGATETTATRNSRLVRYATMLAGLAAAIMMTFAVGANSAAAADVVGNPGAFTVTFATNGSGDGVRFSSGSINETRWPMNSFASPDGSALSFGINVAADGTFTVTSTPTFVTKQIHNECLTGAFLCISAPKGVKSTPQVNPYFAWGGTINPATGELHINMPMRIRNESVSGSSISDCYLGSNTAPINIQAATNKANGVAYNFNTGTARVADAGFTTPTTSGATGGGGSSNCDRTDDWVSGSNQNVPSTDTWFRGNLTITNGSGTPVRPWPVRAAFTVSPDPVGVTQTATFNASASQVDDGVQACPGPDVSDPACGYRWDFDGDGTVDEVTNGPTVTHVYNSAGNPTPKLTIFDVNGKSDTVTGAVWVQALPEAQIDSHPAATTKETVNEFTFSIPANPYSATTQCSVDGGSWSACASGDDFTFTQADDTTGSHNFRVRGITPGGVIGPVAQYDFTIDRVKPRVTVNTHPVNPTNSTSASFTFTADKPNSTLECQLDGGSWEPCGTGSSGSKSYGPLTQSSPNPIENPQPHQFRVRATDQYGNVGGDGNPGGGAYDWDIDLTSPVPTFTTKPAQPSNDVDPVFVWSNNESIQLAQCRLAVNGTQGAWQNCGSLTTKSFSSMADGSYAFGVRTLDIAGNWSNPVTHSWVLETVTPPLSITSTPARYSNRTSAQFLFEAEAGSTTRCQLDSKPVQDPCDSGVKYSYLSVGTHIFSVTATDPALNETTKTYTWDIETAKPAVQIVAASVPELSSTSADANFQLTTVNGEAECRLDGGNWSACDSDASQDYSGLSDGSHTFEVRAVDEYDNVSAIDAYRWLVVANAPTVSFGQTPDANTNKSTGLFTFSVASADANVTTSCSLDGNTAFDCGSPAAVTQLADGDHTFEVTATDTAGQIHTASYDWNVKAKIPGLGFDQSPNAISNSKAATFAFSSDEDPAVTYECRTDNGSFAACTSPVALSGLSEGSHSFTVRATDSVGNRATEAFVWSVDSIAPTVSFTQSPAASTERVAEVLKFAANQSDSTLVCKLDSAAFSACTSPALVKNLAVGAHTFTVKATDTAGNTGPEASVAWIVTAPTVTALRAKVSGDTAANAKATAQKVSKAKAKAKAKVKAKKAKAKKAKAKKRAKAKRRSRR